MRSALQNKMLVVLLSAIGLLCDNVDPCPPGCAVNDQGICENPPPTTAAPTAAPTISLSAACLVGSVPATGFSGNLSLVEPSGTSLCAARFDQNGNINLFSIDDAAYPGGYCWTSDEAFSGSNERVLLCVFSGSNEAAVSVRNADLNGGLFRLRPSEVLPLDNPLYIPRRTYPTPQVHNYFLDNEYNNVYDYTVAEWVEGTRTPVVYDQFNYPSAEFSFTVRWQNYSLAIDTISRTATLCDSGASCASQPMPDLALREWNTSVPLVELAWDEFAVLSQPLLDYAGLALEFSLGGQHNGTRLLDLATEDLPTSVFFNEPFIGLSTVLSVVSLVQSGQTIVTYNNRDWTGQVRIVLATSADGVHNAVLGTTDSCDEFAWHNCSDGPLTTPFALPVNALLTAPGLLGTVQSVGSLFPDDEVFPACLVGTVPATGLSGHLENVVPDPGSLCAARFHADGDIELFSFDGGEETYHGGYCWVTPDNTLFCVFAGTNEGAVSVRRTDMNQGVFRQRPSQVSEFESDLVYIPRRTYPKFVASGTAFDYTVSNWIDGTITPVTYDQYNYPSFQFSFTIRWQNHSLAINTISRTATLCELTECVDQPMPDLALREWSSRSPTVDIHWNEGANLDHTLLEYAGRDLEYSLGGQHNSTRLLDFLNEDLPTEVFFSEPNIGLSRFHSISRQSAQAVITYVDLDSTFLVRIALATSDAGVLNALIGTVESCGGLLLQNCTEDEDAVRAGETVFPPFAVPVNNLLIAPGVFGRVTKVGSLMPFLSSPLDATGCLVQDAGKMRSGQCPPPLFDDNASLIVTWGTSGSFVDMLNDPDVPPAWRLSPAFYHGLSGRSSSLFPTVGMWSFSGVLRNFSIFDETGATRISWDESIGSFQRTSTFNGTNIVVGDGGINTDDDFTIYLLAPDLRPTTPCPNGIYLRTDSVVYSRPNGDVTVYFNGSVVTDTAFYAFELTVAPESCADVKVAGQPVPPNACDPHALAALEESGCIDGNTTFFRNCSACPVELAMFAESCGYGCVLTEPSPPTLFAIFTPSTNQTTILDIAGNASFVSQVGETVFDTASCFGFDVHENWTEWRAAPSIGPCNFNETINQQNLTNAERQAICENTFVEGERCVFNFGLPFDPNLVDTAATDYGLAADPRDCSLPTCTGDICGPTVSAESSKGYAVVAGLDAVTIVGLDQPFEFPVDRATHIELMCTPKHPPYVVTSYIDHGKPSICVYDLGWPTDLEYKGPDSPVPCQATMGSHLSLHDSDTVLPADATAITSMDSISNELVFSYNTGAVYGFTIREPEHTYESIRDANGINPSAFCTYHNAFNNIGSCDVVPSSTVYHDFFNVKKIFDPVDTIDDKVAVELMVHGDEILLLRSFSVGFEVRSLRGRNPCPPGYFDTAGWTSLMAGEHEKWVVGMPVPYFCRPWTVCAGPSEFVAARGTPVSDRVCSPIEDCPPGKLALTPHFDAEANAASGRPLCANVSEVCDTGIIRGAFCIDPNKACRADQMTLQIASSGSDTACTSIVDCSGPKVHVPATSAWPGGLTMCQITPVCNPLTQRVRFQNNTAACDPLVMCQFGDPVSPEYQSAVPKFKNGNRVNDNVCAPISICGSYTGKRAVSGTTVSPGQDSVCLNISLCVPDAETAEGYRKVSVEPFCPAHCASSPSGTTLTQLTDLGFGDCLDIELCDPGIAYVGSDTANCHPLTLCEPHQYEATPPTRYSDRSCVDFGICSQAGSYEAAAGTMTSDRVCRALTDCTDTEFEHAPPTPTTNRVCVAHAQCTDEEYETTAPTASSDRNCTQATICVSTANVWEGEFEASPLTASTDRLCGQCATNCPAGHKVVACETNASSAVCEACSSSAISNRSHCVLLGPLINGTSCNEVVFDALTPLGRRLKYIDLNIAAQGNETGVVPPLSELCVDCRERCPAGFYMEQPCTNVSDSVCAACPPGTYKAEPSRDTSCTPWSSCSGSGASSTSDRTCDGMANVEVIVVMVLGLTYAAVGPITRAALDQNKKEK